MRFGFNKSQVALAAIAALSATALGTAPSTAQAAKTPGTYVTGDFHNHTTCSDGTISMQKLVKKATGTGNDGWGLDWFVQAGHGGNGNRNCTLVEDADLATPAYNNYVPPVVPYPAAAQSGGPYTTWQNSGVTPKGTASGTAPNQNMWRWQSVQEFQYPLIEYLSALKNVPLFIGLETVAPGHEHISMSVITGQMPVAVDSYTLPTTSGYTPLGNANALAQWEYCFDRADTDLGRGNATVGTTTVPGGNNWDCSFAGGLNSTSPIWNTTGQKLVPSTNGTIVASLGGVGVQGHSKSLEALKWMVAQGHGNASYYVPAHLERAGPFNPTGNNGFNIEHLRDFNNTAPNIAFGFETQPGHGASSERGEYFPGRNSIGGVLVDSVGGTTWGGTGIYGAQIGGVWDALLGEGRNFWFFASSDWHNRGKFGADDRRSTQDFQPGEYQRDYVMVRNGSDKLRPQTIVDGLRSGNSFTASGQLIDRMAFIACASYTTAPRTNAAVENLAVNAALNATDIDVAGCATMGEKLKVRAGGGAEIVVSIVVRDPSGTNNSPYSFPNPSLAQIGLTQPLNAPVLDHVDVIRGLVTGYKTPGAADYSGQWPNTWLSNPSLSTVPAAAKNTSAALLRTFNAPSTDPAVPPTAFNWTPVDGHPEYKKMTFRIPAGSASQYLRLRGSNLPASVPFETDANGNPLPDLYTNATTTTSDSTDASGNFVAGSVGSLKIPCNATGTNVPAIAAAYPAGSAPIDGCPSHLPKVNGQKYVAFDVAAWSDLWFYSNPIYIEVAGSTTVAGVK